MPLLPTPEQRDLDWISSRTAQSGVAYLPAGEVERLADVAPYFTFGGEPFQLTGLRGPRKGRRAKPVWIEGWVSRDAPGIEVSGVYVGDDIEWAKALPGFEYGEPYSARPGVEGWLKLSDIEDYWEEVAELPVPERGGVGS